MRAQILAVALATTISSSMAASNETLLYRNPLNSTSDVANWVAEGPVNVTAVEGALELSGGGGIDDHFVFWAPEVFPDSIRITWEFSPRNEPGLAMFFFGAESVAGGSIFDPGLAPRNGSYPQYHSGDIRTLHASYFRRRWPEERAFLLANLRKSPGFNLVAQGADPLPPVADAAGAFYRITVIKDKRDVQFFINDLPIFSFQDDKSTGPVVRGGRIAFRGMTPLVARYRNLEALQNRIDGPEGNFFEEAVGFAAQRHRRDIQFDDRDQAEERRQAMPFAGDDAGAPPLVWTLLWGGKYSNVFGEYISDELRRWGYVFWDAHRIDVYGTKDYLKGLWVSSPALMRVCRHWPWMSDVPETLDRSAAAVENS